MFKVSFKETPNNPAKLVTKMGNETTVMLKGTAKMPEFIKYIPEHIAAWVNEQHLIDGTDDLVNMQLIIYSKGIAKCHPNDRYDTILGERMAESRAKYNIYKFFYELTYRLSEYYGAILYGNDGPIVDTPKDGLMADVQKYEKLCQKERTHQIELLKEKKHE